MECIFNLNASKTLPEVDELPLNTKNWKSHSRPLPLWEGRGSATELSAALSCGLGEAWIRQCQAAPCLARQLPVHLALPAHREPLAIYPACRSKVQTRCRAKKTPTGSLNKREAKSCLDCKNFQMHMRLAFSGAQPVIWVWNVPPKEPGVSSQG